MDKYLKNHDEVLKSIDKIANELTVKDLIKYIAEYYNEQKDKKPAKVTSNKIELHGDDLNQLKLNRIMGIILKNYLIAENCTLYINRKIKPELWGNDHIIATIAGELPYRYIDSKYPYTLIINCKNTTSLLQRMKPEYQDIDNFIDHFSSL